MEKNHYICIPAIDIDSVLKIDKRLYPQAYLEQCKYKLKKRKIVNYINDEIIDEIAIVILMMLLIVILIFQYQIVVSSNIMIEKLELSAILQH